MITRDTIEKIFDAVRIEEVVGDFVQLKRSGANYKGLSPFTSEKTPSFYVSPAKQIFKCFSSGIGGNAASFLMEYEKMSYPEALRYLAKKYGIEIEETQVSAEQKEEMTRRESLYLVNEFAKNYFQQQLWETEEGKAIGLSYFKERGFTDETIKRFHLGYSPAQKSALASAAEKAQYNLEFLDELGLSIKGEQGRIDRFRERVIFPIHNLTGRVAGFGARILNSEIKTAKYLNSPESEVYNKSKIIYGLYQARKTIVKNDVCYLTEGYTDVIQLSQAGIENVVSSSGTSLTVEQVRLIKRLTRNVAILYDGDVAGIKASFRGIDLFLEEDMDVRVLLFPDGHDPDSYARSHSKEELENFIKANLQDFIRFKINILKKDVGDDPLKKAALLKEILNSIALIPAPVKRDVYVKEVAKLMEVDEKTVSGELMRSLAVKHDKERQEKLRVQPQELSVVQSPAERQTDKVEFSNLQLLEENLLWLLVNYGNRQEEFRIPDSTEVTEERIGEHILMELQVDQLEFKTTTYKKLADWISSFYQEKNEFPTEKELNLSDDPELLSLLADLLTKRYKLSDWSRKNIYPPTIEEKLERHTRETVLRYKEVFLKDLIKQKQEGLKNESNPSDLSELMNLIQTHKKVLKFLNQVV